MQFEYRISFVFPRVLGGESGSANAVKLTSTEPFLGNLEVKIDFYVCK